MGTELSPQQQPGLGSTGEQVVDESDGKPEARGGIGADEGRVGTGPTAEERAEGVVHRLQEHLGHARRQGHAECVPVAPGVLDGDQTLLAGDADDHCSPLGEQLVRAVAGRAGGQLVARQVPHAPQQVVGIIGMAGPAALIEGLEVGLEGGHGLRLNQLPQLLGAEQLGQQLAVEGQGLGLALGERRVALVEEVGHVREGQRRGERRGTGGVDGDHPQLAGPDLAHELDQGGDVEGVAQTLAIGLEQDREGPVPRRHGEEVGGPLTLLPERRACTRPPTG